MEDMQFIGLVVSTIITLGAFIAVIMKFVQPINDLRVVIQKLNDSIDNMKKDDVDRDQRIKKHGEEIDDLKDRVGTVETKVKLYHKE